MFSGKLMKFIGIPEIYKTYGGVDTFTMFSIQAMKDCGYSVNQFVVNNLIVAENNRFRLSDLERPDYEIKFYKKYLSLLSDKNKERRNNDDMFQKELMKNIERIRDEKN